MNTNKHINEVVVVKFKRIKDQIIGVLISESTHWLLLKYIPVDFQIDGYVFINKKNVKEISVTEKEAFKKNVLISSKKWIDKKNSLDVLNLNLENIFVSFAHNKNIIQIEGSNNEIAYIGKIVDVKESHILIDSISTRGTWLDEKKISKAKIWCVFFDNDYVNSLGLYIKSITK